MPPRFHSERKSVNTQSSISRDQAYTGFAPILLTRYKKVLMPASFLKMHLESLAHFDLSIHIAFCRSFISTDVQTKQLSPNHQLPPSLFATSQLVPPNSTQITINPSIDAQLVVIDSFRHLICPIVKFVYYAIIPQSPKYSLYSYNDTSLI